VNKNNSREEEIWKNKNPSWDGFLFLITFLNFFI
jgi:hypothetical protein